MLEELYAKFNVSRPVSYTHLLFYGNVILPFVDRFPTDLELYRIMTTKLTEVQEAKEA